MKIMVPLSDMDMLDEFCRAGADEFYAGFFDPAWDARFGPFEEINRMSSFGSQANMPLGAIEQVVRQVHQRGKKLYITLNSAAYSTQQLEWMGRYAALLRSISADGIIVGSLELLYRLRNCGLPLTVSTMGGAYNRSIVSFYRDLGIRRVILPRDMTLQDIEKLVPQFPELEFEAFLMRNGCKYSDANCLAYHARRYGSLCAALDSGPYLLETDGPTAPETCREIHANHTLFSRAFHKQACGLCAIDALAGAGISSLKIVGRADHAANVAEDIRQVRALLDHPGQSKNCVGELCLYGLNCYYPSESLK